MSIDDIYDRDFEFLESDKTHGAFYLCVLLNEGPLLMSAISVRAFCEHDGDIAHEYLETYSATDPARLLPGVRIVRLHLTPAGEHIGVDFTFVIVRIQRRWRARYREFIRKRVQQLRFRECSGYFLTNRI